MTDESDPPRKFYQLKPKEFEQVNPIVARAPTEPAPPSAAAETANHAPPSPRIDVRELVRQGAAGVPLLRANQPANRANEVHAVLEEKFRHEQAAGLFQVAAGVDKQRRRRIWGYWTLMVAVNTPLGWIAWSANPTRGLSSASATVFVCAIAGMTMFTAGWTWHTWFLRTER